MIGGERGGREPLTQHPAPRTVGACPPAHVSTGVCVCVHTGMCVCTCVFPSMSFPQHRSQQPARGSDRLTSPVRFLHSHSRVCVTLRPVWVLNGLRLQNSPGVGGAEGPSGPLAPKPAQKAWGGPGEGMEPPHRAELR